jgi:lipopolysaccharide export system permease protein
MSMKLLDKLVLKDLLPMFLVGVGLFFSLYFAGDPVLLASRLLAEGWALRIVLALILLKIPIILALIFPMGMLFAVLIGFGRLSADSEAVAAFAAGVPFLRIVAPAMLLGVIASGIGYVLSDQGSTWATRRFNDIYANASNAPADTDNVIDLGPSRPGETHKLEAVVHIEHGIDARTGMLRDVTITLFNPPGTPAQILHAKYAKWLGAVTNWELIDVEVDNLKPFMSRSYSARMRADLTESPDVIAFLATDASSFSFQDLRREIARLRSEGAGHKEDIRKAELQMWRIIALPLASLVFAVIGAPLGLRPQRTAKLTGWGLAILIIFGYYVMYTVTGSLADGGSMSPILGAFAPDIAGLVVGAALLVRAAN